MQKTGIGVNPFRERQAISDAYLADKITIQEHDRRMEALDAMLKGAGGIGSYAADSFRAEQGDPAASRKMRELSERHGI